MARVLLIPFLGGLCITVLFGTGFILRSRRLMKIDRPAKLRAIRWSAAGSACSGLSLGLIALLIMLSSTAPELPVVNMVAVALAMALGSGAVLLGTILLSIYWFEKVTLPVLQKRGVESSQEDQ